MAKKLVTSKGGWTRMGFSKEEYLEDRRTEAIARMFVNQIFLNIKNNFDSNNMGGLILSGYAKVKDNHIYLNGYSELSKLINSLPRKKLRHFIFAFVNMTHQAAYHINESEIKDFIDFSTHHDKVRTIDMKPIKKQFQKIILNLKNGETTTKEQLLKEMKPILIKNSKKLKKTLKEFHRDIVPRLNLDEVLGKMRKEGEICFPRRGIIQRIG